MHRKSCDGIDDDVVAAGRDWSGLELLDDLVASPFRVLQPGVVLDVLVADQLRPIDDGARLEIAARAVGGSGRELRIGPHQPLRDPRALARGEVLVLVDEQ